VRSRQRSAYSDGEDEVASRSSGILNPRPTEVLVQAGGHPGVAQQGVTLTITLALALALILTLALTQPYANPGIMFRFDLWGRTLGSRPVCVTNFSNGARRALTGSGLLVLGLGIPRVRLKRQAPRPTERSY